MRVPIACTLGPDAATDRIADWRAALGASVVATIRTAPGRAELRLVDGPIGAGVLIDLARREKACCDFFTFKVKIDADGATLVIEVPEDAVAVLDGLLALRGGEQNRRSS
ncbi:MAG: hypothetical protein JO337_05470 [Acidimicrobiales bacterium]|nr:hypothetical protein [Acidimicrobiales bacterium]